MASSHETIDRQPPESTAQPPAAARRLLLVDDEPFVLDAYAEALCMEGWKVDCAADGHAAIQRLRTQSYDVIVSDIAMPGMDGVQFLRAVRDFDLDVPVVLITGNPAIDTAVHAIEYGAFQYLIKPIPLSVVQKTAQRAAYMHDLARLKRQALQLLGEPATGPGDRAGLETHFSNALNTLSLAFQPIVSMRTKSVFAYEALVRTEEQTLKSPDALFSAAERLERIPEIGRMLRHMAAERVSLLTKPTLLFINLHPLDLLDEELIHPAAPLSLAAPRIVLEINERTSIAGVVNLRQRIQRLRGLGFRIAIDDLGAGQAGLGMLASLEPDIAKIDLLLVRDVDQMPTKRSIVRSMASLCSDLGIRLVAEGVQTPGERDALLDCGCDLLQGFLFGRPVASFEQASF
jgi:EAL domain-containing protein (putative c-di-GMP-specific phosphodiesterase class I)